MSEAPHGAPIKTPGQLIAAVIAAFAIPIIVIWLLAYYVNQSARSGAGTDGLADATVAARIAPIAQVDVRNPNAPHVFKSGEEVFKAVCTTCHTPGAAGAPKFGNNADWAPRISQGYETLVQTALHGKGAMPARGGTSPDDYSDYEIARGVVYMADHSGANFPEPAAPASGTAATQNAAATPASEVQSASASTGSMNDQAAAAIAALPSAPGPAAPSADKAQAGKALYTQVCQACHAAGVMGAPKFGNKADWAPRLKDSKDVIYNYALHGKGNMPPKGGSQASDDDVKAAVDYMIDAAK